MQSFIPSAIIRVMLKQNPPEQQFPKHMPVQDWLLLVVLSITWGISFFFIKIALHDLQPLTIVFGRVFTAAIALNFILRLRGEKLPHGWKQWKPFLLISILNNVLPFTLIVWSETQISSGLTSILNASAPLWGVVIAHFYNHEKLTGGKTIGILLGFGGVIVMIGYESLAGIGMNTLAQVAMLGATFCYAFAGAYTQRIKEYTPTVISAGQVTISSVIMFLLMVLIDRPWLSPMPSPASLGAVLELGLVGTAVAYLLYFRILNRSGASNALLVTFLIPVTALFVGIFFLGEHLSGIHFIGMGLIASGLLAIDGRALSFFKSFSRDESDTK